MLPGICPGCGLRADLDVFCAQADVNPALAAALSLPPSTGRRALPYLRLFSPPNKSLALSKATRLLIELAEAVNSAQVTRRGIAHAAPLPLWEAALDAVIHSPPESLPLHNHAYLFQVAWNLAERAAVRSEQRADERLRHGWRPAAEALPVPPESNHPAPSGHPSLAKEGNVAANPERRERNMQMAKELLAKFGRRPAALSPDPSPASGRGEVSVVPAVNPTVEELNP